MNRNHIALYLSFLFLAPLGLSAQDWPVPEMSEAMKNPEAYTLENVKRGREVYLLNCKSCHGDPGKNNQLALNPMPVDVTSEAMQANSEGALFYKITQGRGVMPPFESTLSDSDRWNLVNFIMNYNPEREVLYVEAPPVKAKLLASVNEATRTVEIMAEAENADGSYSSLAEAPVTISSRKAFGNAPMGMALTGENGRTKYAIPEDVIGDEEGYITIVVSLDDNYEANEVALEKAIVGKPKSTPPIIRKDVLWSTNDNVSIWLLFAYFLSAGGAWLGIAYVIVQLVKIGRAGKPS